MPGLVLPDDQPASRAGPAPWGPLTSTHLSQHSTDWSVPCGPRRGGLVGKRGGTEVRVARCPVCRMKTHNSSFRKQGLSYQIDHLIRKLSMQQPGSLPAIPPWTWPLGGLLAGGPAHPTGGLPMCMHARTHAGKSTRVCHGKACVVQPSRLVENMFPRQQK